MATKNRRLEHLANSLGYSLREVREKALRDGITPAQAIRHLADALQTSRGGAAFSDAFYRELHSLLDEELKKSQVRKRLSMLRNPTELTLKDKVSGNQIFLKMRNGLVVGAMGADPERYIGLTEAQARHKARYARR